MPQFHSRFTLPFGYADATNIVFHSGGVVDRSYSKGTNNEDTDGINFARSTRQYWPQDWLLAGRICCTVLCLQRRWRPTNTHVVPFLVEDELKRVGGLYERAADWQPFSIIDGRLITGQNPASSTSAAQALLNVLHAEKAA
jgi:hypothetical protein